MAVYYPGYYPSYYPPQQPVQQPIQQPVQQSMQAPIQQPQDIQNGGFVSVPNEEIVTSYPVAPGKCVTFKIEGQPIVMEKSMGFSQFENPRIDRYRLVKETSQENNEEVNNRDELKKENEGLKEELKRLKEELKMTDEDLDDIKKDVESLWGEIDVLKQQKRSISTKRDKNGDD